MNCLYTLVCQKICDKNPLDDDDLKIVAHETFHECFKAFLKNREQKRYRYLITFTLRKPCDDIPAISSYIKSQLKRKPLKIEEAHLVQELTKAGIPHWHASVITTKPLKKDRFNYYEKLYGHVDISSTLGTNIEETLNYISKDSLPIQII